MRLRIVLTSCPDRHGRLGGCGGSGDSVEPSGRTQVVASFYPLAFAAAAIGGTRVEVTNLTPAGAEPHDLEITPHDVGRVRSADLVLLLGRGFQPQVEDAAGSGDRVLRLLDTPGLRVRSNGDPHVWLDPLRYALHREADRRRPRSAGAAAERFVGRLTLARPRISAGPRSRAGGTRSSRATRRSPTSRSATASDRWRSRGSTPRPSRRPRDLGQVIATVRRAGATTVFGETLLSRRLADTVARETGARTAVLNPIEGLTSARGRSRRQDYFALMRANLAALRRGLGCR